MPDRHPDIAEELRAGIRHQTWATVTLFLLLAALGIVGYIDASNRRADLARESDRTNAALCTFVGDLQRRIKSSEDFLRDHPHGAFGFSAGTIRQGLENQRRTVMSLSGLGCPKRKF
jgi:hypothetical protein